MLGFFEKLNTATSGRYSFLRLNKAQYTKFVDDDGSEKGVLELVLIYPFELDKSFTAEDKEIITKFIESRYEGAELNVKFVKAYADKGVVLNMIAEYFNSNHRVILDTLDASDISATVTPAEITVEVVAPTSAYAVLNAADFCEKLKHTLEKNFCQNVTVALSERVVPPGTETLIVNNPITTVGSTLVKLKSVGAMIFGSAKRAKAIGFDPVQIAVIKKKTEAENTAICGKVRGFTENRFQNSDYDPAFPEKTKMVGKYEKKITPYTYVYRWYLDDTTGNIECVFYSDEENLDIKQMSDGAEIVLFGNMSINKRTAAPNFKPKAAYFAEIDYSSIVGLKKRRAAEARYFTVQPVKYYEERQQSLFDEFDDTVPAYLKNKTIVVFDFETTGTAPDDEIIEIGAVKMVDGTITETFTTLINPGRHIPEEATAVHGIVDADVADAPKIEKVIGDFFKFTRGAILAGHNVMFDYHYLNKAAERSDYDFDNDLIDTLSLSKQYIKGQSNNRLEGLCEYLKISLENAHRASHDALATAKLLICIAKLM